MIGQRIGHYRLLRLLGEGGMGVVYEAVREDIGGSAAIKVLKSEFALQPELAARFFNEARAANLVEHPGIVKVFDYGHLPSGAAYLAMEFLAGESLYKRIERERRMSEADALRLGRQIAAALAAAHAKQVVHRDLKPENVFIVPDAEAANGERAKILDFGIAKLTAENQGLVRTNTNMLMGTPIYMSPEQCKGSKNIGDRTDVYSFGVMLYEMLAGRTPFVAEEPGEYIGQHIYKTPPPIGDFVPSLTPALQRLIESMLLKDATARPTMMAVARVLKELGNFSSDVFSIRALAEGQETIPLLRALPKPMPPPPLLQETLAAHETAGPPALPDPLLSPDETRPLLLPEQGVLDARLANEKTDPLRDTEPNPSPQAGDPQMDSTRILNADAVPSSAPVAVTQSPEQRTQPRAEQPPGQPGQPGQATWQTINVIKRTGEVESRPEILPPVVAEPRRRRPWLVRVIRLVQSRLRRLVYALLGIPLPPRGAPVRSVGTPAPWRLAVLGVGVALLLLLIVLLLRSCLSGDERSPTQESSDLGRAPDLKERPRVEVPPPPPPELPADVQLAINEAHRQADGGGSGTAVLRALRSAAKKTGHPAAWLEAGKYACQQRSLRVANEARAFLLNNGDENGRASAMQELAAACKKHGILLDADGRFVRGEP